MPQGYSKYAELEDVTNRVDRYVSHAWFLCNSSLLEADKINPNSCESWKARLTLDRLINFSEIILEYLTSLEEEITNLRVIVEDDAVRKAVSGVSKEQTGGQPT